MKKRKREPTFTIPITLTRAMLEKILKNGVDDQLKDQIAAAIMSDKRILNAVTFLLAMRSADRFVKLYGRSPEEIKAMLETKAEQKIELITHDFADLEARLLATSLSKKSKKRGQRVSRSGPTARHV